MLLDAVRSMHEPLLKSTSEVDNIEKSQQVLMLLWYLLPQCNKITLSQVLYRVELQKLI